MRESFAQEMFQKFSINSIRYLNNVSLSDLWKGKLWTILIRIANAAIVKLNKKYVIGNTL